MIAVVVPTNRPERLAEWLKEWGGFDGLATLYVVEDGPARTCGVPAGARHYCWQDIDATLGRDGWIIPRRTDCVRSFGYLMAHRDGAEITITLDDDCYPADGFGPDAFVEAHAGILHGEVQSDAWCYTITGMVPRGVPYAETQRSWPCYLNHGLWLNVPDLDATTTLSTMRAPSLHQPVSQTLNPGKYLPMCGMNLAWRRELTPTMWFGLMGPQYPFDRFGDIWAGLFAKRICDHLRLGVRSGEPYVWHDRASNVWANLRKEAPGMEMNETLWRLVDGIHLTRSSVGGCYAELADLMPLNDAYWWQVREAMGIWARLTG